MIIEIGSELSQALQVIAICIAAGVYFYCVFR